MGLLETGASDQAVKQTTDIFQRVSHNYFSGRSFVVLVVSLVVAAILGRIAATILRRVVWAIGRRADKSEDLRTVNRLRRYETYLVLSIALLRTLFFLFAIYFWWVFIHPTGQPTAIIGASALAAILIGGVLGPILRDLASGSFMMAEQWYGVGDYIQVVPFSEIEGVVERVSLRSTRIRALNGELIWINNQNIQGVKLTPRGTRTLALEIFVDDEEAGKKLIERANKRLPLGPLLVVTPLTVVSSELVGEKLWHITAVGETAPGREWLLERSAVDLIKGLDDGNKQQVIAHGPLFRYADRDAEQSFNRTIKNARKRAKPKRQRTKKKS
ncbi:MAG TPA: mechanosensitive ion channel family protein [Candidatus Saccharimonadales bacterium]